jgi:hypothetical protein
LTFRIGGLGMIGFSFRSASDNAQIAPLLSLTVITFSVREAESATCATPFFGVVSLSAGPPPSARCQNKPPSSD